MCAQHQQQHCFAIRVRAMAAATAHARAPGTASRPTARRQQRASPHARGPHPAQLRQSTHTKGGPRESGGAVAAAARYASHTAAEDGGRGSALTPTACTPPAPARRGTSVASIQPTAAVCRSPRRDSPLREPRLLSHAHTCGPLSGAVDKTKPDDRRPGAAGARRPQATDGLDKPHSHPPRPGRQAPARRCERRRTRLLQQAPHHAAAADADAVAAAGSRRTPRRRAQARQV